MSALPRRAILLTVVLAVVILAVAGWSDEATAQVFQGTVFVQGLPPVDITITLQPGGPALYVMRFGGRQIDAGLLSATVNGSSVQGFIQSFQPGIRPCFFSGTVSGPTASATLDPVSCGRPGSVLVTRVA
jgi:hypothetical protein